MKILVNSGGFSLFSMNKCDIFQLEVHDVKGYLLYYQLVPGRLAGSKKIPVALSDSVSTKVGFGIPRRDAIFAIFAVFMGT